MNTVEIVAPDYNTDIRIIADWILQIASDHHFPIELEERELCEWAIQQLYDGGNINVFQRYEITVLYWQVRGYLRGLAV